MSETDKMGYTCKCGHWNPCASGWAAAHWHEELLHTCEECKVRMAIKDGDCLGPSGD